MNDQSLQIAALLCSRLCHDLISPIGAISNGLEVLQDEDDPEMRETALSLIEASAQNATARLQFARLAFGVAGSMGAQIDLNDAARLANDLLARGKVTLDWRMTGTTAPKDSVKLLLNLILICVDCIPRGGTLSIVGDGGGDTLLVEARGPKARLGADIRSAVSGETAVDDFESRQVQPGFTALLASAMGAAIEIRESEEVVAFHVTLPKEARAQAI